MFLAISYTYAKQLQLDVDALYQHKTKQDALTTKV